MMLRPRALSTMLRTLLVAAPVLLLPAGSAAQQAASGPDTGRLLTSEVLWELKRIGAPVVSPDGRWVVAPVTRYTVGDDKSHTDLWLFSADGSVQRPLTRSAGFQPGRSDAGVRGAP
jgi:hypothetical protein